VEFRNGRKEVIFPERFTADIAATGTCSRTQARLQRQPYVCAADAPHALLGPCRRFPAPHPVKVLIKIPVLIDKRHARTWAGLTSSS